jgi:hypothetical protein
VAGDGAHGSAMVLICETTNPGRPGSVGGPVEK